MLQILSKLGFEHVDLFQFLIETPNSFQKFVASRLLLFKPIRIRIRKHKKILDSDIS